jgi:probable rRNA maturation factor
VIEVEIADPAWAAALPDVEILVRAAAVAALDPFFGFDEERGVAVLLTDDATLAELNGRFRGKPQPTNVLSFPAAPNPEDHLGDLALASGVCAREAAEQNKSISDHLQHLVAHGVLHLLGYDHEDDAEAEEMEGLERVILAGLGVADPYAAEQDDHG